MPVQGKQQEAVVVGSAVMKLALRQTVALSLATSACFLMFHLHTKKEKPLFLFFFETEAGHFFYVRLSFYEQ